MKRLVLAVAALVALVITSVGSAHTGHAVPGGDRTVGEGALVWGIPALLESARTRSTASVKAAGTIDLQLLNVSDWHGQVDPVSGVGGAPVISSYWQLDRAANPNTLTLTAGDSVGATPPISAFFQDEPAIRAMRLMGIQVDTLGNHNFDAGIARLQAQIDLARSSKVPGVKTYFVSSNLANRSQNIKNTSPYKIFTVGGVKVAVIGVTNPEAPSLVFPGNFGTMTPTDPVAAALAARADAAAEGATVFVAITHQGVTGFDGLTGAPFGPLVDFANAVTGFDVIFGDHTDVQYSGVLNGQLVLENRSKGLTYGRTTLTVDTTTGTVVGRSAQFVTPTAAAVTPDPAIVAMLAPYRAQLAPILGQPVGSSTRAIPRADACGQSAGRTCESLVGNVTTDAMRTTYLTDFAITNSGGLRADLTCPTVDNPADFCPAITPPPYLITRGQVFGVLPFGNVVATLSVNGAELKTFLENGVSAMPGVNGKFPQVSGLCFTYNISAAVGSRVTGAVRQAGDGSCTGASVDLTAGSTYALAINDFMAAGGDGYPNVKSRAVTRGIMDQVLADYLTAQGSVAPAIQSRIACTTAGAPACPVVTP